MFKRSHKSDPESRPKPMREVIKRRAQKKIVTSSQNSEGINIAVNVADHYDSLQRDFRWQVDEYFNIADVCCRRWAIGDDKPASEQDDFANFEQGHIGGQRIAVYTHDISGSAASHSYADLHKAADALSHALVALGVKRGDRVALVMPQRFETAAAYMAVFQMGAVAMPLSMLFGPEALAFRLQNSEAVLAICDESSIQNINTVRAQCQALTTVMAVGAAQGQGDVDYEAFVVQRQHAFKAVRTKAEEAAILIYTSGTTGPPKGALLPHRALIGNLSGFICSQNWFGFSPEKSSASDAANENSKESEKREASAGLPTGSNAVFWSPADWAWTGGLMDALLPTLYFGRPIVAFNGRFSPELALTLMQTYGVTHTFLFPTALKAMMKAYPHPREKFQLKLQAIMSAGEAVGDAVFDYCHRELDVVVNEMFGQTEINYVVGNCAMANVGWPAKPGSMGKGYPGHRVAVIDDDGNECAVGVPGDVAVNRYDIHGDPDPIFFLGYWKNESATQAKFTGDWCRTGDMARRDVEGYLWYDGRADDVFKAAGYRIGPGEIENCLVKHSAVANAAVVPKPDRARGAVVKAYVVLAPELMAKRPVEESAASQFDQKIIADLQAHVKNMLAPYEYPKEIEFIDALPMTTTGKVQRRVLRLQEEARFQTLQQGDV